MFLSYVHENLPVINRLVVDLRSRGADVWFDRDALPPGVIWRDEIRQAISRHEFFIACFSEEQNLRPRTYMNEELELAIQEIRLRGNSPWFIPIRLSGEIPDIRVGATRSLRDIQYVDLNDFNWMGAVDAIARAIGLPLHNAILPLPEPLATITYTPPDNVELRLRHQPTRHLSWWTTTAAAALTVAIFAIGGNKFWNRPSEPRVNVDNTPLRPDGMRGPGNAPLQIAPRPDEKDFLLIPILPTHDRTTRRSGSTYRMDIINLNGDSPRVIWSRKELGLRPDGTLPVLVPGSYLAAGAYQLIIYESSNNTSRELARYTMRVTGSRSD